MITPAFIFTLLVTIPAAAPQDPPPPGKVKIERCLICHGKRALTRLSSFDRRRFFPRPEDRDKPLKSDDPAFRAKLFVDPAVFLVSAHKGVTCVECHRDAVPGGHHLGLAPVDCGACHKQEQGAYDRGIHRAALASGPKPGDSRPPSDCFACHGGYHAMLPVKDPRSPASEAHRNETCGRCHGARADSFGRSYHGLFQRLDPGAEPVRCTDCHSNHWVLPVKDPASTVHPERRPATCRKCHEGAPVRFASIPVHPDPSPAGGSHGLGAAARVMKGFVWIVLALSWIHALLWFLRSLPDFGERFRKKQTPPGFRLRFRPIHRWIHLLVILSFFGLALSGLPLAAPEAPWTKPLLEHLGGLGPARILHRTCAGLTLFYVLLHLGVLARVRGRESRAGGFPLLPRGRDLRDLAAQVRWFFFLGPRPRFGRWHYVEKFEYFALAWGVLFMGLTGLVLWFPRAAAAVLPGWAFTLSRILHGEEAFLAVLYVFTVHFFHVHLRPARFPVDVSVFTGRVPLWRAALERPEEGGLEDTRASALDGSVKKAPPWLHGGAFLFGMLCLSAGLVIAAAWLWGRLFLP